MAVVQQLTVELELVEPVQLLEQLQVVVAVEVFVVVVDTVGNVLVALAAAVLVLLLGVPFL